MVVLLASALKLLGVDSQVVGVVGLALLVGMAATFVIRGKKTRAAAALEKAD
jgi:hypothetical protein